VVSENWPSLFKNVARSPATMNKLGQFSETTTQYYIAEIILILEYIHSIGIIHKDIKPSNFLLTETGHLKITDFGLSKVNQSWHTDARPMTDPLLDLSTSDSFDGMEGPVAVIGTPYYLSPEVLLGYKEFESQPGVDWWAVGVMTFEFLTGVPPFTDSTPEEIFQHIVNREMVDWPEEIISDEGKDFVDQMLQLDPKDRLGTSGVNEIKSHQFLNSLEFASIFTASIEEFNISKTNLLPDSKPNLHLSSKFHSQTFNSITPEEEMNLSTEIPDFSFMNLHYLKEKNKELLQEIGEGLDDSSGTF